MFSLFYRKEDMSSRHVLKERLLEEGLYEHVGITLPPSDIYETSKWRYFIWYMKQFFSNKAIVYPEKFRGY